MESASVPAPGVPVPTPAHHDEHEHHGPPAAHQSSRLDPQFLGMLLFIISEVMLFGAFFTAYFFIRVVNGDAWPAAGEHLPVAIAGVNTAILVSSSFTMHWALEGARRENRRAMRIGLLTTLLLYGLTGLHGAHVFVGLTLLTFATIRAFRGHFSAEKHLGVEIPGIYWHFVDVMWIVVYLTIYII